MALAAPSARTFRRLTATAGTAAVALLLTGCLTDGQAQVQSELNADRQANGRTALSIQAQAQAKAQAWAEKIARDGKLSHSKLSDGITVNWCGLGENVGYGGTVAQIEDAYMASPGHRSNILNTAWNGVGVGHATGKVNGQTVIFTVHSFIQTC